MLEAERHRAVKDYIDDYDYDNDPDDLAARAEELKTLNQQMALKVGAAKQALNEESQQHFQNKRASNAYKSVSRHREFNLRTNPRPGPDVAPGSA